ncbi:filamentous hemagglutinin N-terminal domain-containing protein [Argonema galeatum]|uniref:two-partner secretion domain-containing protein n=1 Tax=Argonema galeatum TaxID=2942762 RepID=UPI0020133C62|nr:filamentous hemagglutinin N-terminal domain-containing protein [Argonema galeatum]MCL1465105.1 filamentous hemagglutinin N-terminal domain-containing protein [Argonema galeatum A003/A1]
MQQRSLNVQLFLQGVLRPKVSVKFWVASSLALFYLGWGGEARSQIAPDSTLSTNVTTPDNLNFTINEGNRAGNNLFHSFREFSIPTGGEAFFNNAVDIQNIFSRVTGSSISNIDGLIRANGTANLFLINPNGIIFGSNAKLNIGGSFLGSTANSIRFADGVEFSVTNPQAAPLLSINIPIGLQYGANTGEIRVRGNGQEFGLDGVEKSFDRSLNPLEVLRGKTLTLVGGNIIIDGGIIQAPGGRVELGGIAGEGTVGLNADGSLSFPEGVARADVSLINKAGINVLGNGGASIAITGRNINISGDSLLSAGIATGQDTLESMAGDIALSATEAITTASSLIENNVKPNAVGNSGNISITAKSLSVTNGAQLNASTLGQGKAGSVTIIASDTVSFDGARKNGFPIPSAAGSVVTPNAVGDAGGVSITAKSLSVTNGAQLNASTLGRGKGGSVTIIASDTVSFDGMGKAGFPSAAGSQVGKSAVGNGGGLSITTKSLSVTNGALLSTSSGGNGAAGDIVVDADSISLDNRSTISSNTVGGEGNINLRSSSLILRQNSNISTNATGSKDIGGGNINLNTDILAALENSDITANAQEGRGGEITINAQAVFGAAPRTRQELQLLLNTADGNAVDPSLLESSDITAISQQGGPQLEGTVAVNTPDVDPSSGLIILPDNLVDATRLVASSCRTGAIQSQFIVTGRGGLPPNPNEAINDEATWIDLRPRLLEGEGEGRGRGRGRRERKITQLPLANSQIVEAQGWTRSANGEVILIAQVPIAIPQSSGLAQQQCHAP